MPSWRGPKRLVAAAAAVALFAAIPLAASSGVFAGATTTADSCGYPTGASPARTATAFNESTVTKWAQVFGTGASAKIGVFATDEKSLLLGLGPDQNSALAPTPFTTSSSTVTYGHATNPSIGDPNATDATIKSTAATRPIATSLFLSPVAAGTTANTQEPGDWQQGTGTANPNTAVNDIFGTWTTAKFVNGTYTITSLPTKSNIDGTGTWLLGPGSDTPTPGFKALGKDGFATESRFDVSGLHDYQGNALAPGTYKVQVMTHDGDQNKGGGDVGEYCTILVIPGSPPLHTVTTSTDPNAGVSISGLDAGLIVPVGSSITDTATITGTAGQGNPTGTIDFKLFSPSSSCTTTPVFSDLAHALTNANPSVATSSPAYQVSSTPGTTYTWQDTYNPNTPNYLTTTETCGQETLTTADARVIITPQSATNIVGNAHTFTATLQVNLDGTNWTTLTDSGDTINFSLPAPANSAFFVNGVNSCTTTAGSCSVQVNDNSAELITVHASSTFGASAEGVSGTFTRSTGNTGCTTAAATCDAVKTFVKPGTTLTVADTMTGLPPGATGSVTYKAFTSNTCAGSTVLNETDTIVTAGTAPTSTAINVGPGQTVYFEVTYTGSGAGDFGSFISPCTAETASSAAL